MVKYAAILRYGEMAERDRTATRAHGRTGESPTMRPVTPASSPPRPAPIVRRMTSPGACRQATKTISQDSLDAARVGAEATGVEPVAGRLPRNHQYAGKEFPRELLPPKYRQKGLRFKSTGYPDFEPYAMALPNGKKTVKIELTGSRHLDEALANKAAGLEETPKRYTWNHLEDEGTMMLVPSDLELAHQAGSRGPGARLQPRSDLVFTPARSQGDPARARPRDRSARGRPRARGDRGVPGTTRGACA
jgi:hypothetical protein